MTLATNIHPASENCWKGLQGQRSKVEVICVQMCECYNSKGVHFSSVVLRLACYFVFYIISCRALLYNFLHSNTGNNNHSSGLAVVYINNFTEPRVGTGQVSNWVNMCLCFVSHNRPTPSCLVKRSRSQSGDRCFATAGPVLWNSLPEYLRQPDITFGQFKRSFKTFMFS